jgi:hypothetical protein
MDIESKFAAVLEVCSKLSIEVRSERLGGSGGGICKLKGKSIVFIDLDAEPEVRYERLIADLSKIPQIDTIFLLPEIRADMERLRDL